MTPVNGYSNTLKIFDRILFFLIAFVQYIHTNQDSLTQLSNVESYKIQKTPTIKFSEVIDISRFYLYNVQKGTEKRLDQII